MKILLVEDNVRLSELVKKNLIKSGFVTDIAKDIEEAVHNLKSYSYDAIVLDLNLPDGNGMSFLKQIRDKKNQIPVIILTANIDFNNKIKGLNIGADDYLTKPFKHEELVARLKAILRRPNDYLEQKINIKNVSFDTDNYQLKINDIIVKIAKKESIILEILLKKYNKTVTKNVLLDKSYEIDKEINSNSLEVSLHRLRKILEKSESALEIKNLRGIGYIIS
jgi:DNA-binding response OmpR family regulator|tara:strand:+ start:53 stop:718 length:666 start_codon:yes stop_codon:yes gene_type:complete